MELWEMQKRDAGPTPNTTCKPKGNPLADARRELNLVKEQLRRVQAAADAALAAIQECAARGKQYYGKAGAEDLVLATPAVRGFAHIERTAAEALKAVRR